MLEIEGVWRLLGGTKDTGHTGAGGGVGGYCIKAPPPLITHEGKVLCVIPLV